MLPFYFLPPAVADYAMAEKDTSTKKTPKSPTQLLKPGATVRDKDGKPRKMQDAVTVEYDERDGRCCITSPLEMAGDWFDVREV